VPRSQCSHAWFEVSIPGGGGDLDSEVKFPPTGRFGGDLNWGIV